MKLMASRGFTALGLSELLAAAGVPKGSFYHYFASKEAFGEVLLEAYFTDYLARLEDLLGTGEGDARQRLLFYWRRWAETQDPTCCQQPCLVVKLSGEVSDLSESMRQALLRGTQAVMDRLAGAVDTGRLEGSLDPHLDPALVARQLYGLWLGSTLLAKVHRDGSPLQAAMAFTVDCLSPAHS